MATTAAARPASLTGGITFETLPLEVRNQIWEIVSQRPTGPYLVIKNWLEEIDPNVDSSQPVFPPPVNNANTNNTGAADSEEEEDEENEEDEYNEEDEEDEDEEFGEEDEDEEMDDAEEEDSDGEVDGNQAAGTATSVPATTTATATANATATATTNVPVPVQAAPRPAPMPIGRHTKYRHLLKTFQISDCPPPTNILHLNKALKDELLDWCFKKLVLTVDATMSFPHTSIYTETIEMIRKQTQNSPLLQIRKIRILLNWDSEFLAQCQMQQTLSEDIMRWYLQERVEATVSLLPEMPRLTEITVEWSDSIPTDDSLLAGTKALFMDQDQIFINPNSGIPIQVDWKETFGNPGQQWQRTSKIGLMRRDFTNIRDQRAHVM